MTRILTRAYWSAFSEMPSPKVYGETAPDDGKRAFEAHLGKPFELGQPGRVPENGAVVIGLTNEGPAHGDGLAAETVEVQAVGRKGHSAEHNQNKGQGKTCDCFHVRLFLPEI